MTGGMPILIGAGLVYAILFFCRCLSGWGDKSRFEGKESKIGIAQTTADARYRRILRRHGLTGPVPWQ